MPSPPCSIDDFASVDAYAPAAHEDGKRWPGNFRTWIENNDTLSAGDRAAIRGRIADMPRPVRISVLMPVHNPPVAHLIAAINSVRRQLYPHWELCVADDCSTAPEVVAVLQAFGNRDPRIKVTYRTQPGHIACASNDALALASGAFVALLDHDDLLPEHALYMVAEEIQAHPNVGIIYSDEDKVDARNVRYGPYFKQHFNRDILLGQNCVNHLGVFRRALMTEVEGFRPGTEGAQDYDLTLRVLERIDDRQVRHIPHILYHWRAAPGSTALDPGAKAYAFEAGQRAIAQHLERSQTPATVRHGVQPGVYRIQRCAPDISVSLIVTGFSSEASPRRRDGAWLQSLLQGSRQRFCEVLVAAPPESVAGLAASLRGAHGPSVQGMMAHTAAAWPAMAHAMAQQAKGEMLLFLTAGLCPTDAAALQELVVQAQRPSMGAAGGRLQRPDGSILHDGYVMGLGGVCGSFHANWPAQTSGYFGLNQMPRLCAAVGRHALATRREMYDSVHGFNAAFAYAWADVDLCLRMRQRGYGIVYTPFAAFIAPSQWPPASQDTSDTVRLMHRHRTMARVDPYWNPNLDKQPGVFGLTCDTRPLKPWLGRLQKTG